MEAVKLRFPGSGTSIHTATVKLAGKPRLSDSVVVGPKDQMHYISQDALHRANAVPLLIPMVFGK